MKWEERIVFEYLTKSGFQQILYEPDGNIPPDFSINDEIAVEVRRLSQLYFSKDGYKSLEEDYIRLVRSVRHVLGEFDHESVVDSYWIVLNFHRPLENLKTIRCKIRETLADFLSGRLSNIHDIPITKSVKISIAKADHPNRKRFRIGIETDMDSGGWIIPMYISNINQCIKEKLQKIQHYISNYKKWWLVLVDMMIAYSGSDTIEIIQGVNKPKEFERVIIIDPIIKEITFEVKES